MLSKRPWSTVSKAALKSNKTRAQTLSSAYAWIQTPGLAEILMTSAE